MSFVYLSITKLFDKINKFYLYHSIRRTSSAIEYRDKKFPAVWNRADIQASFPVLKTVPAEGR
jgi:hypothetical protein